MGVQGVFEGVQAEVHGRCTGPARLLEQQAARGSTRSLPEASCWKTKVRNKIRCMTQQYVCNVKTQTCKHFKVNALLSEQQAEPKGGKRSLGMESEWEKIKQRQAPCKPRKMHCEPRGTSDPIPLWGWEKVRVAWEGPEDSSRQRWDGKGRRVKHSAPCGSESLPAFSEKFPLGVTLERP